MCTAVLCCAGSAVCCASKSCCKCMCCCCKKCGTNERSFPRIGYVFFSLFWVIFAIVIMFFAPQAIDPFDGYIDCSDSTSNTKDVCYGISFMYRVSFILACFHVVMMFFGICPNQDGIRTFHDGCWILKFALIFISVFLTLFIPNVFFQGYGYFAQVISTIYLLYQVIALVSFAYLANDRLVKKYNEGSNCWGILIIVLTVLIYSGGLTLNGFLFYWFQECGTNLGISISTLAAGVLAFILVIVKTRQDSSIFTTSMVFIYTVYLAWSAMGSRPDAECNRFIVSDYNTGSQITFGLFFAILALMVTSAVSKSDGDSKGGFAEKIAEGVREQNEDDEAARQEDLDTDKKTEEVVAHKITKPTVLFHVIMVVASVYYAMVLTNWGNPSVNSAVSDSFGVSWLSFWVKIVSQWVTFVLFFLTLLLPLCSKRDY